jgi:hypothetical protein
MGENGTWFTSQADVTTDRAIDGTVYHNTTGKTMFVVVYATTVGAGSLAGVADSIATPTLGVVFHEHAGAGAIHIEFMVLNGYYYKVTESGAVLGKWFEYY